MNIILLSGGSGKRLWPLSNDIRSKQFIKMFKRADGSLESMVQRVFRQIAEVDTDATVTIATSKRQASVIKNQLGEQVNICVEPDRRDTFPAIALAVAFLCDVQGISENESVVVCPVDPYVENTYFAALQTMADLAASGNAKLTLMGIEPIFPSEKYGYILPRDKQPVSPVDAFKEKPDAETAARYIERGALWNGGVFAFRLGYLLERARELLHYTDYQDLFDHYSQLQKISFDYAVVEHEKSIQVMRYAGEWKDVGSWNTFAEAMGEPIIGNARMEAGCKATNIVNELNIPILCMGCKNLIIAASADGILVSEKSESAKIKPFVDQMEQQVMYAEKSWGSFTVLDVQKESLTIKIKLNPGRQLSYHSHRFRDEVWTVTHGSGKAIIDSVSRNISAGDVIVMNAGTKHTVEAGEKGLDMVEVQLGNEIHVEDKQKYELQRMQTVKLPSENKENR